MLNAYYSGHEGSITIWVTDVHKWTSGDLQYSNNLNFVLRTKKNATEVIGTNNSKTKSDNNEIIQCNQEAERIKCDCKKIKELE